MGKGDILQEIDQENRVLMDGKGVEKMPDTRCWMLDVVGGWLLGQVITFVQLCL